MYWILHDEDEVNYRRVCKRKFVENIENILSKEIILWGAGKYGLITKEIIEQNGFKVAFFVDSDKTKQGMNNEQKLKIENPEVLDKEKHFVIVSTINYYVDIEEILYTKGFRADEYTYIVENERYNKNDVVYRNCSVGRYTVGYIELLSKFPIASRIGRYCSINATARIAANHPKSCVTTHSFLDRKRYMTAQEYRERKRLIEKYGLYKNNHIWENSSLRNNGNVEIGNDVWIGANVIILPNVKISDGAIIGAGAIVTHDVEPYAIVGGVPAKVIGYRFEQHVIDSLLRIKWWEWPMDKINENIELLMNPEVFCETYDTNRMQED